MSFSTSWLVVKYLGYSYIVYNISHHLTVLCIEGFSLCYFWTISYSANTPANTGCVFWVTYGPEIAGANLSDLSG